MTHQAPAFPAPGSVEPGRQIAQLRHALALVEQIAGRAGAGGDAALDRSARITTAYGDAPPISQRRFDALVAETAIWAAAGVEALLSASASGQPGAAAGRLADELGRALGDLERLLGL